MHVDGAFGLWAAASPAKRHLVEGAERAHSWAVDGHKWLNVPYDAGFVLCADRDAHAASMAYTASYLVGTEAGSWAVESSRRARGFATWAGLRELGRDGVAELVDRCCALAERFAERLAELDGVEIGNEVVLNQALASFGSDERTDAADRRRPAGRHLLGRRHHLAGQPLHAHLHVEPDDDRGGRGPLGRGDRAAAQPLTPARRARRS